jgi:cytochrome c oxidase assembly protein subunit 15
VVVLLLGGLQAVVGWLMVESGLVGDRVAVVPQRLAIHLGLALILLCALVWTGLEAWAGKARPPLTSSRWPAWSAALAVGVFVQILLGALVAGNDAGLVYNDWPLFAGHLLPGDYLQGGLAHSLLHSQAAVQMNHRLGAYVLFVAAVLIAVTAQRAIRLPEAGKTLAGVVAGLITLQAVLGIVTLRLVTPLPLAIAHQALAAVVLAAALCFAWRARRP